MNPLLCSRHRDSQHHGHLSGHVGRQCGGQVCSAGGKPDRAEPAAVLPADRGETGSGAAAGSCAIIVRLY